jgi:hypothetical protein
MRVESRSAWLAIIKFENFSELRAKLRPNHATISFFSAFMRQQLSEFHWSPSAWVGQKYSLMSKSGESGVENILLTEGGAGGSDYRQDHDAFNCRRSAILIGRAFGNFFLQLSVD